MQADGVGKSLMPGDETHGFILESVDVLDDYHGYGYLYRHRITGMEVYHVANDDPENFFGFIFKTPPLNDCGAPHIIEHCVLAGSKRYPVRDPFMSLLKGSANTFMNAMTYPDYTVYPAASPLPKDFAHLFSVYADAVFNPLLREETFRQEGIRLTADADGGLAFDGVVYNEMLGELSDHDAVVGRQSIRSLYPDTPYYYESGGDPRQIIRLGYRQFAGYYARYYHPSNCRVFLYGDQPVAGRLELLDDRYLADYSAVSSEGPTPLAKPWVKPKSVSTTSGAEEQAPDGKDATVTISWATTLAEDPIEVLTLTVLTDMLLGNPGAPLYKAIIDSHLCKDVSQVSGMDTSFRQMPFTVGFRGIDPADAEAAQNLVLETLQRIAEEGIPVRLVQNAVKRQEFLLKELSADVPTGLRAMSRAVRGWLQTLSPHVTIGISQPLAELKRLIAESVPREGELFAGREGPDGAKGYFERWILTNLVGNPHRCLLTVKPDPSHNRLQEEAVRVRLEEIRTDLGKDGIARLQDETERFLRFEEQKDTPQALATIPRLTKDDLPASIRILPQRLADATGVPMYFQSMETNGIIYTDGLITVDDLDGEDQLLLPLFTRMLHMVGVGEVPYEEVALRVRDKTGGLHFFLENGSMLMDAKSSLSAVVFRMKCLQHDHAEALSLVSDILRNAKLDDPERIGAVINDLVSDYESNVTSAGQMYASQRAASRFSGVLRQSEVWNGLTQWFHLVGLDPRDARTLELLGARLESLKHRLASRDRMTVHICAPEADLEDAGARLSDFVGTFPHLPSPPDAAAPQGNSASTVAGRDIELFRIPSSVSFSALVCPAAEPFDPRQAHQTVLANILTTNHLWEQVRGVGGAYGVGVHIDMLERLCVFTSYRDPRIEGTLSDFRSALLRIAENGVADDVVEQAVISIVSRELRPLYPKEASMVAFRRALYGITDSHRSDRRSRTLGTTADDVRRAAKDLLESVDTQSVAVVIAGQEMLEREAVTSERLRRESIKLPL